MRARGRPLGVMAAGLLWAAAVAPSADAASTVLQGNSADVAVDAAGTAYVAAITGDETGTVCVLPRGSRTCAATGTFSVPSLDLYRGDLTVALGAPGVVDVIVAGSDPPSVPTFLARSVDGARSFAPPVRIFRDSVSSAALGPDGRYALTAIGFQALAVGVAAPDGSATETLATRLALPGFASDVAWDGGDVLAAGSANGPGGIARLPAGADPTQAASWQTAPLPESYPQVATGPAGAYVLAQVGGSAGDVLVVRRIAGVVVGPPVRITPQVSSSSFDLAEGADGRLVAAFERTNASFRGEVVVTASGDGGLTWSSPIVVAPPATTSEPRVAIAADDSLRVTNGNGVDLDPVSYASVPASALPLRTTTFGPVVVSARARCLAGGRVAVSLRAAQDGAIRPLTAVLRRARLTLTRSSRVRTSRFGASARPRTGARARIRLTPRSSADRTLTLPLARGEVCP